MPRFTVLLKAEEPGAIQEAAELLRNGRLVAFATETVYGLGANAFDNDAVASIFAAKSRPAWDPLIVHLPGSDWLGEVAVLEGDTAGRVSLLTRAFWPGPLTLLLPRTTAVPNAVTAGRSLVGVRVPAHTFAQALLRAAGVPVAAPSANRFGHVSPTTAAHVLADLDGRIDAVLDAGPCRVGVESTVLDPTQTPMVVYRAGAVTTEEIQAASGVATRHYRPENTERGSTAPEALPSPGVGLRHYAPEVPVRLIEGSQEALRAAVLRALANGQRAGVLLPGDWPEAAAAGATVQRWGRWSDVASLATALFGSLRVLEAAEVDIILAPLPEPGGVGDALRDRLQKAAKPR